MMVFPAFGMPGGMEWILIFLVVLLVFGAKRLPEIARSLGKASKEFKKARREFSDVANDVVRDDEPEPVKTASSQPDTPAKTEDESKDA